MKIKKIRARSFREALTLVKKELGAEAVILSSEDKKGMKSYVEVTAAIDYDIETGRNAVCSRMPSRGTGLGTDESMALRNEIISLRESIESMKTSGYELKMPEARKKMFYFLKERSIRDEFALQLVDRAGEINDLEEIMMKDMDTQGAIVNPLKRSGRTYQREENRIVMLIGPTGVGKTTTVAKLASKAIKEGNRVAMISIDTYKIGAAEQIRIYSRMIGIPLDIVSSGANLRKSINRFHDRDIILIDSTGQNPREKDYVDSLKNIYETGLPIETQLLLSASSDCDFLMDTRKQYSSLPVNYIAFTKTDEAVKLGSIYNLCRHYRKPVAYITTGQRVPGNIEFVDSRRLTNLILRTGSA